MKCALTPHSQLPRRMRIRSRVTTCRDSSPLEEDERKIARVEGFRVATFVLTEGGVPTAIRDHDQTAGSGPIFSMCEK